jgi:hypothetical protein
MASKFVKVSADEIIVNGSTVIRGTAEFRGEVTSITEIKTNTILAKSTGSGVLVEGVKFTNNNVYVTSDAQANIVVEKTTDSGVTIDGVLFKDGQIASTVLSQQPLVFKGCWDARNLSGAQPNGNPPLISSTGNTGEYYLIEQSDVTPANNATLDGENIWFMGDSVVFKGPPDNVWAKVANKNIVNSVNSQTGSVVIDTHDTIIPKAMCYVEFLNNFDSSVRSGALNISVGTNVGIISTGGFGVGSFRLFFVTPLASANYSVGYSINGDGVANAMSVNIGEGTARSTGGFGFRIVHGGGYTWPTANTSLSFIVFENA